MNKLEWIKTQIIKGEADFETAGRLNTLSTYDNLNPQEVIPTPINLDLLWGIVPPLEAFNVLNSQIWIHVLDSIERKKDAKTIKNYITAMVAGELISQSTAVNIGNAISGNMPDPDWNPKVTATLAELAGFDLVLVSEVESAINL